MDAQAWEDRYRSGDRLFGGNPNGVLIAEAAGLPPGRALDAGCGEGADAIWLARRGWQVTAVDVSRTALDRAATAAADFADRVTWTRSDLAATPPPAGAFDLVSALYFPLRRDSGPTAPRDLLDAVAPGGTLLFVGHDLTDMPPRDDFDPEDYYRPAEIAELLDAEWTVQVNETRPRTTPAPAGTGHTHDTVLRARRQE